MGKHNRNSSSGEQMFEQNPDQRNNRAGQPLFNYESTGHPIAGQADFEGNENDLMDGCSITDEIKNGKEVLDGKTNGRRKSVWKKILLGVGCFFGVLAIGIAGICWYYFGGLNSEGLEGDLGIDSDKHSQLESDAGFEEDTIVNIALFGIDSKGEEGRSDAIIILSVNKETNAVKLISVQRDSYVPFNGSEDKIGHAYAYGGPELAIKTLNETFDMNISDYITVNFSTLAEVIDSVGGVNIDVSKGELGYLNEALYQLYQGKYWLYNTGYIELNGPQAVAYARIRHLDGDKARTGRQREVVMAMFDQVKQMDVTDYPALAKKMLSMVTTSFTYADIMDFLPVLTSGEVTIQETSIPGTYDSPRDIMLNEISYLAYDLEAAAQHINDFIYKGIDPETPPVESSSSSSSSSSKSGSK